MHGFPDLVDDFDGTITDHDYNLRGLEDYRIEAKGEPGERHIDTTWHPDFRLPTAIVEPGRSRGFTYTASGLLETLTLTDNTGLSGNSRTWTWDYTDGSGGNTGGFVEIQRRRLHPE